MNIIKLYTRMSILFIIGIVFSPAVDALAQDPQIEGLSPSAGSPGTTITINGSGFYTDEWASKVELDGEPIDATPISSTQISFVVPQNIDCIGTHDVRVINPSRPDGNGRVLSATFSNTVDFNVPCPLELDELIPRYAFPGDEVVVLGLGFKSGFGLGEIAIGQSRVRFAGAFITTTYISPTELEFTIPLNATCGPNRIEVVNPSILGELGAPEDVSNWIDIDIFCITSINPASGPPGTEVEIRGGGFGPPGIQILRIIGESEVRLEGNTITSEYLSSSRLSFVVPPFAPCGQLEVSVFNRQFGQTPGGLSNAVGFEVTGAPCNQQPPPIEPPDNGERDLPSDYDENGDCLLSDQEFFAAVDDWIAERIDNPFFFRIVDAWIANDPVCFFSAANSRAVQLRQSSTAIEFVMPLNVRSLEVEIFDLQGELVTKLQSAGRALTWNQLNASGSPVSNGVYLYVVYGVDVDGHAVRSEIEKFVLVR